MSLGGDIDVTKRKDCERFREQDGEIFCKTNKKTSNCNQTNFFLFTKDEAEWIASAL